MNQASSRVKSNEFVSDSKQLPNEFTLSEEENESKRVTTNAWNSKTKIKLGQHIILKNKYKDVKALVKSKAKPLHDRASGLKPNHIQSKSQSVEGQ